MDRNNPFNIPPLPSLHQDEEFAREYIAGFWQDFSIADAFGESAIRDTAKRAIEEWIVGSHDPKYTAGLVCCLNWKIWALYETNEKRARLVRRVMARS